MYMLVTDTFPTLRRHWAALALAGMVGILCVAPPLYFALHEPRFAGVQMIGADAEDHYVARINQVYEGYSSIGNTFLPNKSIPFVLPGLGENIVARIGMLLTISAPEMNVFSKFIFPLCITLLAYILAYTLFKSRAAALIGTAMVTLGDGLTSGPQTWLALLHGSSLNNSFLEYARPINPQISHILFFGAAICIYRMFLTDQKMRWYWILACGTLTGSAIYVSPYIFSFLVILQVVCFLWLIYTREYKRSWGVLGSGVVTTILMIPFFLNYLNMHADPSYLDVMMRTGVAVSHTPIIGLWIPIILTLSIFFLPRRYRHVRPFFIMSSISLLILLNQQLITGHIIQPGHYHWYVTIPLVEIIIGMYAATLCRFIYDSPFARICAYTISIVFLIYNATLIDLGSYAQALPTTLAAQRYSPALAFLNVAPEREFVWANNDISGYISTYTSADNANTHQALNYLIPRSYFEQTLFINYRLRGVQPKDILTTMRVERGDVSSAIFALYWRNQAGSFAAIPDIEIDGLAEKYQRSYATPLDQVFRDLGITTIIWDRVNNPEWKIDSLQHMTKVYSSRTVEVYRRANPTQPITM